MKIIPLDCRAGYLEARRITAAKGLRLASNVLHDDYLAKTEKWKEVKRVYPAWGREIIVHPAKDGRFRRYSDAVDSETGWRVPANFLEALNHTEDIFRKGIGLVIDPEDVLVERGGITVIPASIFLLDHFLQQGGGCGKVDDATRIPLGTGSGAQEEKRWLYRTAGIGVRPLVRGDEEDIYGSRRSIICGCRPEYGFWVAGEAPENRKEV